MAGAFCPSCRRRQQINLHRGNRVADHRCAQCAGPLVGGAARAARLFDLEADLACFLADWQRLLRGEANWLAYGDTVKRVAQGLATRAMRLYPEHRVPR
jgi:hypothetical protein